MELRKCIKIGIGMMLATSMAVTAQAQTDADDADEATDTSHELGSIQVTARRVEETIQTVPVAVSAFSEQDLRDLQATRLDDIQNAVPNVNIVQGRASASSINAFIRGIGQPDALQTFDPGVGIYVDDVYMSRIQGGLMNLYDVERIEVLRGPQGTLYGKNSPGGAIKVITRTPRFATEGIAELTMGNYGLVSGNFYLGGNVNDNVGASFAGRITKRDGFVTDPGTGRDYNDDDSMAFRTKLHIEPSPEFNMTLSADYTRERNAATLGQQQEPLISVDLVTGGVVVRHLPTGEEWNFETSTNLGPDQGQDLDHWGLSASFDWMMNNNWTMRGITAYRDLDTEFWIEFDNTTLSMSEALVALDQSQFSQELQFHYSNHDNFRAVFGGFYMKEDVPSEQLAIADDFLLVAGAPTTFLRTIDDDLQTTSWAVFGQGTWSFADDWSFSLGARYSEDKKDYERSTSTFFGLLPAANSTYAFEASDSWSAFTPSASLSYQIDPNMMTYISASRGFKSGGFNGRANAPGDTGAFDPEFVWTYELGFKGTFLDNRLLTNAAIFRSDYEDFQARVAEDIDSFPVLNAGKLRIEGFELEAAALLPTDTTVSMQLGYLDARYVEFFDARFDDADRSDDNVPFSPKWTFRLAGIQTVNLANGGAINFGADAVYRDDTWLSVDNQPNLFQDSFWLYNAFARYQTPSRDWEFSAGIRNITDKVYKIDAQEFSSVGNIQGAFFGAPRTFYGSVRYNF